MKTYNSDNGFTLVELIMVIVIIGILSAVAVPKFVDLTGSANAAKCAANRGAINSALSMTYAAVVASDPSQANWIVTAAPDDSMFATGAIPECPTGGTYSYSNGITSCDADGHGN